MIERIIIEKTLVEEPIIEKQIPRERCVDSTLTLLNEGYLYITNRTKRYHSDVFETRLLGKKVICMKSKEASKLFYNTKFLKRKGALPKRVQKTLFGVNAVQTMDGRRHIRRKRFFMSLLGENDQDKLAKITFEKWKKAAKNWEGTRQVVLFDEVNHILCQAVCEWAKVPLVPEEEMERTQDFIAMVNNFGTVGPKYWQGKMARKKTEEWIRKVIEDTRSGKLIPGKSSVLHKVAFYKEDGELLDSKMAAIELINILRPIIAISRFITFMALGLHEHKEYKDKLLSGDKQFHEMFVQEVRRYYPFAPFLGAVVKKNFSWNGYRFKKGTLVLLDLYGTNHDPKIWGDPEVFRPERFIGKGKNTFTFIPQGGGDTSKGHRCPGEGMTVELMKASLDFLLHHISYEIPKQDLSYSLTKIPSLPRSGFLLSNIRVEENTLHPTKNKKRQ